MTSTDLVARENAVFADLEKAARLPAGSVSLVGLDLDGAGISFEEWEAIGFGLGHVHRWTAFALGVGV